jgi:hypothetical protein
MHGLASREAQRFQGTKDIPPVRLQFLAEMIHNLLSDHLGAVCWPSGPVLLDWGGELVFIDANALAQIGIIPK